MADLPIVHETDEKLSPEDDALYRVVEILQAAIPMGGGEWSKSPTHCRALPEFLVMRNTYGATSYTWVFPLCESLYPTNAIDFFEGPSSIHDIL